MISIPIDSNLMSRQVCSKVWQGPLKWVFPAASSIIATIQFLISWVLVYRCLCTIIHIIFYRKNSLRPLRICSLIEIKYGVATNMV